MKKILLTAAIAVLVASSAYAQGGNSTELNITPEEARAIAKEAYVYGYPMVDAYRIFYSYFVDENDLEFKAPWNHLKNTPRVYGPNDKAIQTPNSDTPYSALGMDLRAEPIVISVPDIDENRYYSIQLIDAYTHNFAYIGSRATGNKSGNYLVAGPDWEGETPAGIDGVYNSETYFGWAQYRTQLINSSDLENVKKVQEGYKVQTLSQFLGQSAPESVSKVNFMKPMAQEDQKTSMEFFNLLNFTLNYCPPHPSEKELMGRFSKLGIGAGKTFKSESFSPEIKKAIADGMMDGWKVFNSVLAKINAGELASGDVFGTREFMKNNYANRMLAAVLGIFGNSKNEAMYPTYYLDANGEKPNASKNNYTLHFAAGQLPPVNAFWSLTMYKMPESLLTENPLNRYLLNSPMISDFEKDSDGGITLYIQNESPGKDLETNWLPAPDGSFSMILRLYWPKAAALSGAWKEPKLQRQNKKVEMLDKTTTGTL